MKKKKRVMVLGLLAILLVSVGCATTPQALKQEDIRGIRKLAIVTSLSDEDLKILDHTEIMEQPAATQFGVLGVLMYAGIASAKVKLALAGDPDSLRQAAADFPVKEVFDQNFVEAFPVSCEILSPQQVDALGTEEYPTCKSAKGKTIHDYSVLCKKLNVDTVLEIDFIHGLAVCKGEKRPTAVVAADVSVLDIEENRLLMKKSISSDDYYIKGYTVDEFRANEAELFKKEILEAVRGFAHLVASEFGAESLREKSYWHPESGPEKK